jgi:hypothetical protein
MKIPDENVRNYWLYELEILNHNYQTALALLPLSQYENYEDAIFAGYCYQLMNQPAKSRTSYDELGPNWSGEVQPHSSAIVFAFRFYKISCGLAAL